MPSMIQFPARRIMAAVTAALITAAVFVQFDWTPQAAPSVNPAGEANIQMLRDEHAAIAGYLKQEAAARTQADQSAARELDRMKVAALEEAQPVSLRSAQRAMAVRAEKSKANVERVVAKSESIRVTTVAATAEPMQLLAMTDAEAMQAPRPPALVRGRVNRLTSTVERIPSWFTSAAGWVVDAVPVPRLPTLPQLPMRHFRV